MVSTALASAQGAMLAVVTSAQTYFAQLENFQSNQMLSSLKIVAKQTQVAAEQRDAAVLQAEQAAASVAVDLANKEMVDKTILDFSSQGFNPCYQLSENKRMVQTEVATRASVPGRVSTEVEGVGGHYSSVADALAKRERQHQALFCTQSEKDAGLCSSVGAVPGGDMNASLIFNSDPSANAVAAKNATINNIIGMPDEPLPAAAANTPQGMAYVLQKKEKDATLAFSAYSLKAIQADVENFDAVLGSRVGQYFGTAQAEAWAKDQASQAERGVVLDMVKISGLGLKIGLRELEQSLRREANAAVELALENRQINGRATEAAQNRALATQAAIKVAK
nr:hypothetical protein [Ralstonia sp. ASV6]